jgi:heme-degrading monooxygenase HmoA
MHVRFTTVKVNPVQAPEMESIYLAEIVPEVKKAKGNHNVLLLQSTNARDEYISVTMWDSKASADAYDASGQYKALVGKVLHTFSAPPVLTTYDSK